MLAWISYSYSDCMLWLGSWIAWITTNLLAFAFAILRWSQPCLTFLEITRWNKNKQPKKKQNKKYLCVRVKNLLRFVMKQSA